MRKTLNFTIALLLCLFASINANAETKRVTLIFDEKPTAVNVMLSESKDVWVTMKDLKLATRYVVKPQGICRDELCFPIPKNRKTQFVNKQGKTEWFNLSEFARLVKQPVAVDEKHAIYYFGARPDAQNAHLNTLEAPNFTLPDMNGKMHSLTDFRGKKVLLITWASW
jgi:hypothetical protein